MFKLGKARMLKAAERGKRVSEIVNGIKVIKFNAWENIMIEKIEKIRKAERSLLFKYFTLQNISLSLRLLVPIFCCLACFSVYQSQIEKLTVANAFSMITLFANLINPVKAFFEALDNRAAALVASSRLDKLLQF